jgi:regulator of protease activity HflC (stomatin/prohibitin superfamily)
VTEAEGKKQATVTVAEGDKQSAILRAEGGKQSQILAAEGYANALSTVFNAAKGIDSKTMSLQYLDALKAMGAGASTKFIFPMEFTNLLRPLIGYASEAIQSADDSKKS